MTHRKLDFWDSQNLKFIRNRGKVDQTTKNRPKINQTSITNRSKIGKQIIISAFGPQEAPRAPQEPSKTPRGHDRTPIGHRLGEGFWEGFGAMLAPRATKRPFKMHSKFSLFLTSIFHRFFTDFGRVLGGFWAPCWLPKGIEK